MEEKDKKLLEKDICARLPYGLKVDFYSRATNEHFVCTLLGIEPDNEKPVVAKTDNGSFRFTQDHVKPYLRSLSSMTEDEKETFLNLSDHMIDDWLVKPETCCHFMSCLQDWLNKNMFDYRGLIPMGLALEALEGMYKKEHKETPKNEEK
jgi:hypothetical protein